MVSCNTIHWAYYRAVVPVRSRHCRSICGVINLGWFVYCAITYYSFYSKCWPCSYNSFCRCLDFSNYGKILGADPRAVIIDEFLRTWVATLGALYCAGDWSVPVSLASIGFVLFRIIDIWKPLGCRWVDQNVHGGWGCMLDDVLAGFYAQNNNSRSIF